MADSWLHALSISPRARRISHGLLNGDHHACVRASSYNVCVCVCWGGGKIGRGFFLSWNVHSSVQREKCVCGLPALNCGRHTSGRNTLEVGGDHWGGQMRACFIAPDRAGGSTQTHKWQRGEEVRNIILKRTDKSVCAATLSHLTFLL